MTGSKQFPIPFFGNYNDRACAQCVYRMALASFFPDQVLTWEEMDEFCGAVPGKYTWPYKPILNMVDLGLDLVVYNTFDSALFLKDHEAYLSERYGPDGFLDQMKNSDIPTVLVQARQFLDYRDHHKFEWINDNHTPEIIKNLLDRGYLVAPWVNLRKLNGREGVSGHILLIHRHEDGHFIAHDPGENDQEGNPLNQIENRLIAESNLLALCSPKELGKTNFLVAMKKRVDA